MIDAMLCNRWSSFLLMGFFLGILGAIAISSVFWSTMASVVLFGILLIASGSATVLHAFWSAEWKGFFAELLIGILAAVVGWFIIMNPLLGATTLTLMLALYFVISGIFKIVTALMYHLEHWGWQLLNGGISLLLGLMIIAQWPTASLWILGLFLGIDLLMSGWTSIMLGLAVRKTCKRFGQETA